MENNFYKTTDKYNGKPNEVSRSKLIGIALDVFGKNTNLFETPEQGPFIDAFIIYGLFGVKKAIINPKQREVISYNRKHNKKVDELVDRYNKLTPEGDWGIKYSK